MLSTSEVYLHEADRKDFEVRELARKLEYTFDTIERDYIKMQIRKTIEARNEFIVLAWEEKRKSPINKES